MKRKAFVVIAFVVIVTLVLTSCDLTQETNTKPATTEEQTTIGNMRYLPLGEYPISDVEFQLISGLLQSGGLTVLADVYNIGEYKMYFIPIDLAIFYYDVLPSEKEYVQVTNENFLFHLSDQSCD